MRRISGWLVRRRREGGPIAPFLLPYLSFFSVFIAAPLVMGFLLSFYKWDLLSAPKFLGFGNYLYLLFRDSKFWTAVRNTFVFAGISTPLLLVVPLLFAIALNRDFRGRLWAMIGLIAPSFFPSAAVLLVWSWMLDVKVGIINYYFQRWGLQPPAWLSDPATTWLIIIGITLWWSSGFNTILYLSALQKIPKEQYEAAALDGAGSWAQFWHITVPWLRNVMVFISTMQVLSSFMIFDQIYILTSGGPYGQTRTIVYYLYETGFQRFQMGRASAMSWLLFGFIAVFAIAQLEVMTKRVRAAE
ncbi:carbohydrate ABC transporter permease [Candidatus Caldatribacterium saccharofermentans]|uniref:Sugar ABC transporter permease n=1 Tax=Candidatus Caldatribacterium saccharofermentans TaxID=1454753 RepID=A0A7V4TJ84_9BACT